MISKSSLVSIIVVTYNSAEYVIETLNSCLAQTYSNIEIIISDDGSTDRTLELCYSWLETNAGDKKVKIITSQKRKGIPANCNRGAKVSSGKWLKFLGADDILEKDAIDNLLKIAVDNVDLVFSKFITFGENVSNQDIYPYPFTWDLIKNSEVKWSKKLDWKFLLGFSNVAPGAFIRSETYHELGGYDESFYLLEDLPLWYKLFSGHYTIKHCSAVTVRYRIHKKQATGNGISPLLKKDLLLFTERARKKYIIPYYHNKFQIFVLSNRFAGIFIYLNVFQWYISIYNRFRK